MTASKRRRDEDVMGEFVELRELDVADVGCGTGSLSRWLWASGAIVTSIECNEGARMAAVAADAEHGDRYLDGVAEQLPVADDSVDLVVFSYSFHHVPPESMGLALQESCRVLRPGGTLYVLEPMPHGAEYEAMRLVDDETGLLEQAQRALDSAAELGLSETERLSYSIDSVYPDAEGWEAAIVGVDPTRAARFDRFRSETIARFVELATFEGDHFVFEQPNLLRVFRLSG